jgi:hypothetical protein
MNYLLPLKGIASMHCSANVGEKGDVAVFFVNQYGWINIWTAILGHFFALFPAFFEIAPTALKRQLEIFPDTAGNAHIYILLFTCLLGIKRRARLRHNSAR